MYMYMRNMTLYSWIRIPSGQKDRKWEVSWLFGALIRGGFQSTKAWSVNVIHIYMYIYM